MWELLLKAFSVYISSTLKFIFGPLGGKAADLNIFLTILVTIAGMMTSVTAIAYFGDFLRNRVFPVFKRKPTADAALNEEENRKRLKWKAFYRKYGLGGIAFLTPVILTPIGGTLLAVGFGSPRHKILVYMLISAACWSVILTFSVYLGYDWIVDQARRFSNV